LLGEQQGAFTFMGCVNETPVNYLMDIMVGFLCLMIGYAWGKRKSRKGVV